MDLKTQTYEQGYSAATTAHTGSTVLPLFSQTPEKRKLVHSILMWTNSFKTR